MVAAAAGRQPYAIWHGPCRQTSRAVYRRFQGVYMELPGSLRLGSAETYSQIGVHRTPHEQVRHPPPHRNARHRGRQSALALAKRLQGYHSQTVPILTHYEPAGVVARVDANKHPNDVWTGVAAVLPKA